MLPLGPGECHLHIGVVGQSDPDGVRELIALAGQQRGTVLQVEHVAQPGHLTGENVTAHLLSVGQQLADQPGLGSIEQPLNGVLALLALAVAPVEQRARIIRVAQIDDRAGQLLDGQQQIRRQ